MQMINVLKRLAELDAGNPRVDTTAMIATESLHTQSEVAESKIDECGMMPPPPAMPHTPASINITAGSGDEITDMLKAIVSLAGVQEPAQAHVDMVGTGGLAHPEHGGELSGSHGADDMAKTISIIDSMNAEEMPEEGIEDRVYDNSPDEEVGAVDPDQIGRAHV